MMPLCIRCGKGAMAGTTFGRFCDSACEELWVKECLAKLSADDFLELMTKVQVYTGPERRKRPRAKGIGA